jgi:iron(III) transport system permease protein
LSQAAPLPDTQPRMARSAPPDAILFTVRALVVVAVALMAMPLVLLLVTSVRNPDPTASAAFGWMNFHNVLGHPLFASTIRNTLVLGAGSIGVMLLFTLPFAWLFTRTDLPGKSIFLALLTSNVAMPGFTAAMGYVLLLNPSNGIVNTWLRSLGAGAPSFDVYGLGWMIFLQGLALVPPAFFMIVPTLQAIDASLEEAAAASGVRRWVTTFRITLPLAAPAIFAAAIYYLIIAIETFDYASMLGFPVRTYVVSTWLFQMLNPGSDLPRYGDAAALGMLTTAFALCLGVAFIWATRQASRYVVVSGKRRQQRLLALSRGWVLLAWSLILLYVLLALVLPLLMVLWASLVPFIQPPSWRAVQTITLDAYREAWAQLPPLALNNGIAMVSVPTIAVAFAACISWVIARSRSPWRRALDIFVMVAIAVPSIVGALAFVHFGLATYEFLPLYGTIGIIVLAMAVRLITWANRSLASALGQIHPELEEACAASGVQRGRAFLSVTLPVVRPAVVFSWFWIALLTLRELTIPVMLARPNSQTVSTAIWSFNVAGNADIASALSVMLVLFIGVLLLVFGRATRSIAH